MSSRDERRRPRSEEKSSKHKLPSVVVQLPISARSASCTPSSAKGDRKKQEKVEKTEKEKKQLPAATVTLNDLRRQENVLIIPDDTGDVENAVFDTAVFERGYLSPLPLSPERVAGTQQQQTQRVARPAPASSPSDGWKEEMRKEMQAMMRDSMREMMAMLPGREPTPALGTGPPTVQGPLAFSPGTVPPTAQFPLPTTPGTGPPTAQGPLSTTPGTGPPTVQGPMSYAPGTGPLRAQGPLTDVPRDVPASTHHELLTDEPRWAHSVVHTGGHAFPVGHPVAVRAHVIEDETLPEWHEDPVVEDQEEVYNPFQGIEGLDGYSLTGLGSALPRQKVVVTPSVRQLSLWRQVRGGRVMDPSIKTDMVERIYSGDPAAKPFLDAEAPMEIPTNTRFQAADATLRRRQKDLGIIAHALTTGLDDLEGASKHLLSAVDDLEEGPIKDRILEAHREVTQASTHPLGHALRILASKFNDVAKQRRTALETTSLDRVLSQLIKTTPLGFDSLLASSLQPAIQASSSRRQQDMLMAALRSNSRASRPARRDRSRSPVRRPHSNQNHSQGFRQSTDRQPFRGSSRGSRGSGSRGTRGSRGSRGQRPFSRRS